MLRPDATAYEEGDVLRQPDLAKTYRAIAKGGERWFYEGTLAESIGRWMKENGGILTADDFANYRDQASSARHRRLSKVENHWFPTAQFWRLPRCPNAEHAGDDGSGNAAQA